MTLDGMKVTRAVIESYTESLLTNADVDAILVGAGPVNLMIGRLGE